jgi:hypothetical protein
MSNELEKIWNKVDMANLRFHPGICLEGPQKTAKTSTSIAGLKVEILT